MAAFAGGALVARLLEPRGPDAPLELGGRRLPTLCLIRLTTGRRCPSCGMTRGFVYMFRLDPLNAIRANRLTPVAFALSALEVARSLLRLLRRLGVPARRGAAAPAR